MNDPLTITIRSLSALDSGNNLREQIEQLPWCFVTTSTFPGQSPPTIQRLRGKAPQEGT